MKNYKKLIAEKYAQLLQNESIFRIKVKAGFLELREALDIAVEVRIEFYSAMQYTDQVGLAHDLENYFYQFVETNWWFLEDEEYDKAKENLQKLENVNFITVVKELTNGALEEV